jgi:hypothetical protein
MASRADHELDALEATLRADAEFVHTVRRSVRQGIDEVIDGRRTRRRAYAELSTPEKSFCGIRIESALVQHLDLKPGRTLDVSLHGADVDVKASSREAWNIGPKQLGGILLLVGFSEERRQFSVGLIRGYEAFMNPSRTRDAKRTLNRYAKKHIRWIALKEELPISVLASLSDAAYRDIFRATARAERVKRCARHLPFHVPFPRRVLEIVVGGDDPLRGTRADVALTGRLRHPLGEIRIASFRTNGLLELIGLPTLAPGEHMKVRASELVKARGLAPSEKRARRGGASGPGASGSRQSRRTARGAKGTRSARPR